MADPSVTTLLIRDASGSSQNAATVSQGGNLFPAHVNYGWDGSSTLHPVLVDSAGRPLVSGAAAAGSAVAGNPVLVGGSDGTNARSLLLDSSGRQILGPSTQIIGKVGIDQTTDGVTNFVRTPFSRLAQVGIGFTPSASYSTANNFGGLFTFDVSGFVGSVAAQVRLSSVFMTLLAASFTVNGMTLYFFNALPTTTFTDASTPALNSADKTKLQYVVGFNASTAGQLGTGAATFSLANQVGGIPLMTDAAGKIYMAISCGGAETIGTPAASEILASFLY